MINHRWIGAVSGAMLSVGFVAAAWAGAGFDKGEMRLGACAPLSGMISGAGKERLAGARAYADYVNRASGGVRGRALRLIEEDDQSNPDKAIDCFNRLMERDVFLIGFGLGSPQAAKYVTMAQASQVPFFGNNAPFIVEPFKRQTFSVGVTHEDVIRDELDGLWEGLGLRRFAVAYVEDALGAAFLRGIKESLAKRGAKPVAVASLEKSNPNVDEAVRSLQAAEPEAVILGMPAQISGKILKKAKEAGLKAVYLQGPASGADQLIAAAGDAAEGLIVPNKVPSYADVRLPTVALYQKVLKEFSPEWKPGSNNLEGFVEAMVIVEGLRRAGPEPTREKFIAALESMGDFDVGLGPRYKLRFNGSSHRGFEHLDFSVIRGGREVFFQDWRTLKR